MYHRTFLHQFCPWLCGAGFLNVPPGGWSHFNNGTLFAFDILLDECLHHVSGLQPVYSVFWLGVKHLLPDQGKSVSKDLCGCLLRCSAHLHSANRKMGSPVALPKCVTAELCFFRAFLSESKS